MHQIDEILFPEPQGVLTLTGGGGKTSLMFHLARLLARSGKRVLTTTTTKIFYPTADQSRTVLIDPDPHALLLQMSSLADPRCITAAAALQPDSRKLVGFAPDAIGTFAESGLFDWIIVEGDGSARRPLKAHAAHEPVIPAATTVLVAVAGLEALGAPFSEELVFRSAVAGTLMGLEPGEVISETAFARLISHPAGLLRGAPPGIRQFIFLNKADNRQRLRGAAAIAGELASHAPGFAEAVMVGQAREEIVLHALYPLGGGYGDGQ